METLQALNYPTPNQYDTILQIILNFKTSSNEKLGELFSALPERILKSLKLAPFYNEYLKNIKDKRAGFFYDDKSLALKNQIQKEINNRSTPAAGDFVKIGTQYIRIASVIKTCDSLCKFQPSNGGSFNYDECCNGQASFSGGLDSSIQLELKRRRSIETFQEVYETKQGGGWIWYENQTGAHRGLDVFFDLPVWIYIN